VSTPKTLRELLEIAASLGKALAEQPRFAAIRAAEDAVIADPKSRALADELDRERERAASREMRGEAPSEEERQAQRRLEESVRADSKLQDLARVQADFAQLLNEVHEEIYRHLRSGQQEG
jgi:cell fate (sporulation/competence/biofilm development) regulator YlbF (YheA/YmcA/DUF963 family)